MAERIIQGDFNNSIEKGLLLTAPDPRTFAIARYMVQDASAAAIMGFNANLGTDASFMAHTFDDRARKLNIPNEHLEAALLIGAVAHKTKVQRLGLPYKTDRPSYSKVWEGTRFKGLAIAAEYMVATLKPTTEGLYTTVSLDSMRQTFSRAISTGQEERIVITGLNGSGKSTAIEHIIKYLGLCGVTSNDLKFPLQTGFLSEEIGKLLIGVSKADPLAMQLLLYAQALDLENAISQNSGKFTIMDRHPYSDTLVYGPRGVSQLGLIALSEVLASKPTWIIVLDRHPASALKTVLHRETNPRIFEGKLEQMINQLIGFAELTAFPGVAWVNTDIPENKDVDPVKRSVLRVISEVINTGAVQRFMVRQGMAPNFEAAFDLVDKAYYAYRDKLLGR